MYMYICIYSVYIYIYVYIYYKYIRNILYGQALHGAPDYRSEPNITGEHLNYAQSCLIPTHGDKPSCSKPRRPSWPVAVQNTYDDAKGKRFDT